MSMTDYELGKEAAFWEQEYYEIYTVPATIEKGDPLAHVQRIQSAVMRHYVSEMKRALEDIKNGK
jgi:hypothetical protein